MRLEFFPSVACGEAAAPPSKSAAHRALIAAALAKGESRVTGVSDSEDMRATLDCLTALGASFQKENGAIRVRGIESVPREEMVLNCRESGSTLRFLIPFALSLSRPVRFTGAKRLFERNFEVYEDLCREKGFLFEKGGDFITVCGSLSGGDYFLRGDISSQFFTGLFFALPRCGGASRVTFSTRLESASYLDLTVSVLKEFGVSVQKEENGFFIPGGQKFLPCDFTVEGDWSNAAFPEAFSYLGGKVKVTGLKEDSLQGDRVYRAHFKAIRSGFCTIDLADCPDLGPVLMALASLYHGALFQNTARLKIKESDRADAMREELGKCGAKIRVEENTVLVEKSRLHAPTLPLFSHNDHRVAMALSLVLSRFGGVLEGAESVKKSYPDYWDVIRRLGIKVQE